MIKAKIKDPEQPLLERVAKKDKKAFEQLYELTSKSIFAYLFRMLNNKETAEDIHVEVFAQVWKTAMNFKGKSKVKTWIFGIARNLALNEMRREKMRRTQELYDTHKDHKTGGLINGYAAKQHMQTAMNKISAKHREILDLVFYHEMAYAEVASLLGIPENTVKTRVYYAKGALKEKLIEMEGADHG